MLLKVDKMLQAMWGRVIASCDLDLGTNSRFSSLSDAE